MLLYAEVRLVTDLPKHFKYTGFWRIKLARELKIGKRLIGQNCEPFIICEISANHNGSLDKAFELISAAAATGCDAIKLQTYTPDTMTIDHESEDFFITGGLWDGYKLYDLYREAHTPFEWHKPLFEHARQLGVEILSTPFDETAADLLESLDVAAYKIASFELTDIPLIKYVAKKNKPLIMSTGLANLFEISSAVNAAQSVGNNQIVLLHCISSYPAPIEQSNVRTVAHLADTFDVVSGLSDHTLSNAASIASVAIGGSVIEKHFTIRRADGGPDGPFSLEPKEFSILTRECKEAWYALGKVDYALKEAEIRNLKFRRSIYFVRDLEAGSLVSAKDVKIIRPGFGLEPGEIDNVIGKRLSVKVTRGTATSWDYFI